MILSISRRTDIPAFYSEWLFNRIKEGFVYVRNPMNIHQIGKVSLSPKLIDGIVFWTKNPAPLIERLYLLDDYVYYFQFTLNAYGKDIEPKVPSKNDVLIPLFQYLSRKIGKEKVVWRYDPVLLNHKYTMEYHKKYFKILVEKLSSYTEKCTVSFLDMYKNIEKKTIKEGIVVPTQKEKEELLQYFSEVAKKAGIYIDICADPVNYCKFGIKPSHCIDKERFERIGNYKLIVKKDKSQRPVCCCIESIDIGSYNTCKHECLYCYANYSNKMVSKNNANHDPNSPLLFGAVEKDDIIIERNISSNKDFQISIFD